MPKINPLRSLENERNVATRIRFEREKRGWTYDGLAKRMTHAGNPMQASAIYKIERADPPRRITVDELVAFCRIFELDASDMLQPMGGVLDAEAKKIVRRISSDQAVLERVLRWMPSGSLYYPLGPDNHPTRAEVSPDPISDAFGALFDGFMTYAEWYVQQEGA